MSITGCHLPPGTSKWNKIEHRLLSPISANWRGRPLTGLAVIVSMIAETRTTTGLRVRCGLDKGAYPKERRITEEQMRELNLKAHKCHGEWNYTIRPNKPA